MQAYKVAFDEDADKDLYSLDKPTRKRILSKIEWLRSHCDEVTHLPLSYEFKDFFKLRIGKWRVLYSVDYTRRKILIAQVDRRDRIYKR